MSLTWSILLLRKHTSQVITFLFGIFSGFVECPTSAHWVAAKRVLRFLEGTQETGITISSGLSGSRMQNDNFARLSAICNSLELVYRDLEVHKGLYNSN